MKQLTIRGFDGDLERHIRRLAQNEGVSLNQAVLRLLRRGAGLDRVQEDPHVIGRALDHLMGTWSDEEAAELMEAVKDFDGIDESLWR